MNRARFSCKIAGVTVGLCLILKIYSAEISILRASYRSFDEVLPGINDAPVHNLTFSAQCIPLHAKVSQTHGEEINVKNKSRNSDVATKKLNKLKHLLVQIQLNHSEEILKTAKNIYFKLIISSKLCLQ